MTEPVNVERLIEGLDAFVQDYGEREYPAGYAFPAFKENRAREEAVLFGQIRQALAESALAAPLLEAGYAYQEARREHRHTDYEKLCGPLLLNAAERIGAKE